MAAQTTWTLLAQQGKHWKLPMQDDERCCGTGTCMIDASGRCWCGQQWDGEKMCAPSQLQATTTQAAPQAAQTVPYEAPERP